MKFLTKAKYAQAIQRAYREGRRDGYSAAPIMKNRTSSPQRASVATILHYAKQGCPMCKSGPYNLWWDQYTVGRVIFEFCCGGVYTCDGNPPKVTSILCPRKGQA